MIDFLRVTVKCSTLNSKCFTTGFGRRSVCIAYKVKNLTIPFPHDSDLPVISVLGNFALTKWSLKLFYFCPFLVLNEVSCLGRSLWFPNIEFKEQQSHYLHLILAYFIFVTVKNFMIFDFTWKPVSKIH